MSAAASTEASATSIAALADVGVTIEGNRILDRVTLEIGHRGHLAVLGPNGAGKTTLLRILSTYRYPTDGKVRVLDTTFGRGDLRALRSKVGLVSVGLDPLVHERAAALPLVAAACIGATWPPPRILDDLEVRRAAELALDRVGAAHLATRRVDTLSQGERQRVRIARAIATDPRLLLLDEPFAGLDLGGRERLLGDLDRLLAEADGPTVVMVTHHLEELPTGIVDAALLRDGRLVAAGPSHEVLTDALVSTTFGLDVAVANHDGRWHATASGR